MVASLDAESIRYVVTNDGRSRGLVRCEFSMRPNSYDHSSSAALRKEGRDVQTKMGVWDFLIIREDGSGVRLHPEWSKTKVKTLSVQGPQTQMATPSKGFGKSAGRGSFRAYSDHDVERFLRFDANKIQEVQKRNAAVAANSS